VCFCIGFAGEVDIDEQYLCRGRFRCQLLCPGWSVRDVTGEIVKVRNSWLMGLLLRARLILFDVSRLKS